MELFFGSVKEVGDIWSTPRLVQHIGATFGGPNLFSDLRIPTDFVLEGRLPGSVRVIRLDTPTYLRAARSTAGSAFTRSTGTVDCRGTRTWIGASGVTKSAAGFSADIPASKPFTGLGAAGAGARFTVTSAGAAGSNSINSLVSTGFFGRDAMTFFFRVHPPNNPSKRC